VRRLHTRDACYGGGATKVLQTVVGGKVVFQAPGF
jgi:hypothetical protein